MAESSGFSLFLAMVAMAAGAALVYWAEYRQLAIFIFAASSIGTLLSLGYMFYENNWLPMLLKPLNVIALGLAIAGIGLIWQYRAAIPEIKVLPDPRTTVDFQHPVKPKRSLSKLEKECIDEGLFKILDVINKKVRGINPATNWFAGNWEPFIRTAAKGDPAKFPELLSPILSKIEETRIAAESAHLEIYQGIPKDYAGCAADLSEVNGGSALAGLASALVKFHEGLTTLKKTQINDHNLEGLLILLRPLASDVDNASSRLFEWLESWDVRREAKRKEIDE